MWGKILLFVLLLIDSYLMVEMMIQTNTLSKVRQIMKQKNDKYYQEMLKNMQKNRKVKLKTKETFSQKIMLLVYQTGLKSRRIH